MLNVGREVRTLVFVFWVKVEDGADGAADGENDLERGG